MLRKQWQTVVLKLIRRNLTAKEKKQVQSRLQAAYKENGDGFYVHAPKQRGNVKEQLGYIGRYMRRPAIAIHRIKEYDGEKVVFSYIDKKDGQEKLVEISVEEFISRLIRHLPDEQFKTIRHYGVYSRRIKGLCKKLVTAWQQEARRWVVKAKQTLRRRNWRERIKAGTGKDPLICPKCECYYEYKGEVCLEEGVLRVKYAVCKTTKAVLERMINDLTGIEETKTRKEEKGESDQLKQTPIEQREDQLYLFAM